MYGLPNQKINLEIDFTEFATLILSAVLALGGMTVLFSSFDDDDDDEGGGAGSPIYEPSYSGTAA